MNWLVLLMVSIAFVALQFWPVYFDRGGKAEPVVVVPSVAARRQATLTPTARPVWEKSGWDLPFTAQAPRGEWEDKRQQDGCEEASVLMAFCAFNPTDCPVVEGVIDRNWAREKILDMHRYQEENWGSGIDTAARDTAERLLGGYFQYPRFEVKVDIDAEEMVSDLRLGGLVLVTVDGRKLFNPNFRNGGPERHMLVVIGYDHDTGEFVTNDPGTRKGKGYRYARQVLMAAMGDYPTGNREPLKGKRDKVAVVVR